MRIESFLRQSPVFQASRIVRRMEGSLNAILREEGLTFFEALLLTAIFFEKRGIQPSELARTFETTRGNVSHSVSSLEAKGLVRRRIDPEDARAFRLVLEASGRRRAARVAGILDRMQTRFEETIGDARLEGMLAEMRTVEELCARLARAGRAAR